MHPGGAHCSFFAEKTSGILQENTEADISQKLSISYTMVREEIPCITRKEERQGCTVM